ncbi:DUF2163 domain-containing protein [Sulfitobacter mediterraneus]|uniref:DUF2163 domain-containing protein n=1 Tax=Sulfitobacter mediterraneus TaxID=83219 RepID=UPI0019341F5D|nr:DUF2163 domain-containing protein [Sulfitobacter mediterraneus]MBM1631770.1 DUF2163 domain-containing protein [Sulfitobacter mediterraneus]MBM1639585.1 DUF2163 domain-containing protein [Sulfitobacter mediterraneus]MBM1643634.1 DUF2163 domain-containing protein [Sulfitobacter mediterraneus]MBM1647680.1 DUF2163 domain-containing protein [Sulfitobacter mediterraneus]MBM1651725.1 DUF2163 domain-containing protein [Sulfitobacter mediterraneus]
MGGARQGVLDHLAGGLTTLCHAWAIERADGKTFAFTDHDMPLAFEGFVFEADAGLSARAIAQTTGLAVDNTEALGALSHASIREDEIEQGRFDGAAVKAWLVNWQDPDHRMLKFSGSIGELRRIDGAFRAELRGLTEALNRPMGRVYQKPCTAVLGDKNCRFDLSQPGYRETRAVEQIEDRRRLIWDAFEGYGEGWFERGRLEALDGAAAGLWSVIKHDRTKDGNRVIDLWEPLRAVLAPGDTVRLIAGCDKRLEICRLKFDNLINFQGFPDIPSEDWVVAVPKSKGANTGGSRR